MNKSSLFFKMLFFINTFTLSFSVNAASDQWCASNSPVISFYFSACAPSPEALAADYCDAHAQYMVEKGYKVIYLEIVNDVTSPQYQPDPPTEFYFGCYVDLIQLDTGYTNYWLNTAYSAHLAPSIYPFNKKKSTEDNQCNESNNSAGSKPSSDPKASNPVRISTGEKIQTEIDYKAINPSKVDFIRYYNSHNGDFTSMAPGWSHNYDKKLSIITDSRGLNVATAERLQGRTFSFRRVDATSAWISDSDVLVKLISYANYHELILSNDVREQYNLNGELISIIYLNGYQIDLTYNSNNLLATVSDNIGSILTFSYNTNNILSGIVMPGNRQITYSYVLTKLDKVTNVDDATFKTYIYDDVNQPNLLSGLIDERGNRYSTWTYDTNKRVVIGEHINGVEKVTLAYGTDAFGNIQNTITNSKNQPTVYTFNTVVGVALSSSVAGPGCATCGTGDTSYTYDPANGNLLTKTTKGITTQYNNYDANHNPNTIVEAFGTPEAKTTTYTYDPQYYSRVATKTEPSVFSTGNKITTYTYDVFGNILNISTDGFTPTGTAINRTVALQYNGPLNQLTQIDGPRPNTVVNDITLLDYYANTVDNGTNRARLKSITQGGILLRSNIQYTASGKISSETRTNGLNVTYSYYAGNDRLDTYTETVGTKSRITKLTYLPTGEVATITLASGTPDSLTVMLGYDAARRLTSVTDAANNRIEFVLDTESNVTNKNIVDSNGVLKRALVQTFDVYSRLQSVTQANEVSGYTYAPDGTLQFSSVGDALQNEKTDTAYQYDGLKRLTSTMQNTNGSDLNISNLLTQYGYDVNDNLISVVDPKNGTTSYVYDDLGNLLSQTSPDTGTTSFINDEAGNRIQQTDANNIVLAYSYDGLNRIKSITGINSSDNISVTYDSCIGGLGRICGFTDASGLTAYQYDGFGHTNNQAHTELGINYNTAYVYNLLDRITQITLPSGRVINKAYNANAQVASIDATVAGTMSVLIDDTRYAADGQLSGFTYGNGYTENRIFDMAGRITNQNMPDKPIIIIAPDTTAPVVIAATNIITEASATLTAVTLGTASANDDVDGVLLATADNLGPYPLGLTTVTWSATDAAGNSGSATQTVTITDSTPPTITAPANVAVISNIAITVTLGAPVTSDLFGIATTSSDAPTLFPVGTTIVTWTAIDTNGNSATATQTVTVTQAADTTAPVVTAPADITTQATATLTPVTLGAATATDDVDGTLTASADNVGPYPVGVTTVTWSATDAAGNIGNAIQTVTITAALAQDSFQQDSGADGIISIEANSYESNIAQGAHTWDIVNPTGAVISGALQANPNTGSNLNTTYLTDAPHLTYSVNFVKTGTHYIWIRGIGSANIDNSLHVGLDGQPNISSEKIDGFISSWSWITSLYGGGIATIEITTAGEHVIDIWMREDGMVFDKILFTTNPSYVPTATGPVESAYIIGGNTVPTVAITAPSNNSSYVQSDSITFTGTATDVEDSSLSSSIQWRSDIDGVIASGASITTNSLTIGTHIITASVTDSGGLIGSFTTTISVSAPFIPGVFQQDTGTDGLVVMEATKYNSNTAQGNHTWDTITPSGAVASGALQANPNIGDNLNATYLTDAPHLTYKVNFVTSGIHYIWIRGHGLNIDNSLHVGLDGLANTSSEEIDGFTTTWSWVTSRYSGGIATIDISTTGEHVVDIWMREDGTVFDKILLTTNPNYVPTGTGPIDSVVIVANNTTPNDVQYAQTATFRAVATAINGTKESTVLTDDTFTINPKHHSTVVLVMVTDEFGKTMAPKAWYQSVKQGRWTTLASSQVSNLEPDVMMVVSDTKIDLWQLNNTNHNSLKHQQQLFNGKAWALSQNLQQVNHIVWAPSQPDASLRPEVTWQYVYDSKGNITTRTVDTTAQTFVYDALNRLTDDVFNTQTYGYDKNGNRTTLTDNGTATTLVYDVNSNRMNVNGTNTVQLDNVGNTINDGNYSYGYNDHNRLTSVDTNISYVYNALGQRTRKITPTGTTIYHYDLAGKLLSETTDTGVPIKDYVYLDEQPIAQLSDVIGQPTIAYIHTDHLKTPRKVSDATGKVIWSWDSDAFGKAVANTDPDGDGRLFEMNLRFAGQYFDSESGLFYNYFRYYDPSAGRYITSDPIGLDGGLNTFGYVGGNPLYWVDLFGLATTTTNIPDINVRPKGVTIPKWVKPPNPWWALLYSSEVGAGSDIVPPIPYNQDEPKQCPPTGSKPISETDWSGDHQDIKGGIGAGPADNTKIDPSGHVWGENPDGSWTDHGPAGDYTGSGNPSGRKGKDRKRRR